MNNTQAIIGLATLLGGLGMWLMLPRGAARGRMFGAVLGLASLGLFAGQMPLVGDWVANSTFYVLAGVTVAAAAAAVTLRNPVYCAIWFALSLLGTAGLLMFQGAQFLGVATVVVYAGAILVTFLFVLMLAQPEGHAFYDRLSWEAPLSAAAGAVMVGLLTFTMAGVFRADRISYPEPPHAVADLEGGILAKEHVARLGGELFGRHLVGVEIAGTLLLVALVGCVAILAQIKTSRAPEGERSHG